MFFKLFCSLKVMMTVWRHTGGQIQHWECYAMFRAQRCWFCTQNQISSGGFTAVLLSVILDSVILFQQKGAAHTQKKNKFVTSNPEFPTHCQLWLLLGTDVGSVYHPQIGTLIVREGNAILISHQQLQGMSSSWPWNRWSITVNECANPGIWYCHWYNSQISVLE